VGRKGRIGVVVFGLVLGVIASCDEADDAEQSAARLRVELR
jgi:hypothetical protein